MQLKVKLRSCFNATSTTKRCAQLHNHWHLHHLSFTMVTGQGSWFITYVLTLPRIILFLTHRSINIYLQNQIITYIINQNSWLPLDSAMSSATHHQTVQLQILNCFQEFISCVSSPVQFCNHLHLKIIKIPLTLWKNWHFCHKIDSRITSFCLEMVSSISRTSMSIFIS